VQGICVSADGSRAASGWQRLGDDVESIKPLLLKSTAAVNQRLRAANAVGNGCVDDIGPTPIVSESRYCS